MDSVAEDMMRECGDFGPYQFVMLAAFCLINIFASIHYFSQTIILFVPEHWWVSELEMCPDHLCLNFAIGCAKCLPKQPQMSHSFYYYCDNQKNVFFCIQPTIKYFICSHFRCYADELANKTIDEIREIYSHYSNPSCTKYRGNVSLSSFDFYKNDSESCDRWIYELDHGYQSMSSEVSKHFPCGFIWGHMILIFFNSWIGCVTRHGNRQSGNRCFSSAQSLEHKYLVH